jgi:hypothetical protein
MRSSDGFLSSMAPTCQAVSKRPGWVDSAASGVVRRSCGTCAVPGQARQQGQGRVDPAALGVQAVMGHAELAQFLVERASTCQSAKNESGLAPRIRVSPPPLLRAGSGYTTGTDILCSHIYPVQPTRASLCVGLWSHVYCSIEIASQCTCCYYLYGFSDPLTRNTLNLVPGIPVPCTGAGI